MSYTKRKLMGLLTLGTATLGTVSSGVTSAGSGFFSRVKNFFNPTTQTKETKKKSERIIDASRGYGAAINLANIICEDNKDNKEGVIDLLKKELNIFSENKGQENLSEAQLLEKGNELLKIAYDLGIENKKIFEIFSNVETHSQAKVKVKNGDETDLKKMINNTDQKIELYTPAAKEFYGKSLLGEEVEENSVLHCFNLYLMKSNCLVSKKNNDGKKDFIFNIDYYDLKNNEENIAAVKKSLESLKGKIFDKLKGVGGDKLKDGISSIMQVIGEQKGGDYFKDIIDGLMQIKVKDKSSNKEVSFGDSTQFKELIRTIEKKEGNLKDKDLPKDTQDGNNKIEVVKEMIKFSDKDGVLFEVLDSLGYTRSDLGRFFDNKYVRVALGVAAAVGIAYVAGIPILSSIVTIKGVKFLVTLSFFKLAAGCLAATNLLDLRNQSFETWAWSNIKSAVKTTTTIVKGVGSIIGKGMSLFEGYKW